MGICLCIFLIGYNWYLIIEATQVEDLRILKLHNYYPIIILLLGIFFSERFMDDFYQRQFTDISWFAVAITFITILLTNHGLIYNPYYILGIIDFGMLMATVTILISGSRHGAFNEE